MPITVDDTTRCAGCMAITTEPTRCEHCGYESGSDRYLHALAEGTCLNHRFVVGRILGKPGGYGITYLAWDKTLNTAVAIKEFLPQRLATRTPGDTEIVPNSADDTSVFEEGLFEFMDEARLLIRFTHPNIARVRDFFQENGTAYMVMDYYEGHSLGEHMAKRQKALTMDEAIAYLSPILDGLGEVHEAGYIHRDIKPTNIYLTHEGWPILLDFGAARYALGDQTQSLTVMLTPGFAPVEQYLSRGKQGPWTDIYSCAATLYYLLSGHKPTSSLDRQDEDDLHTLNPAVSKGLSKVIMRGLALAHTERPASAATFKKMLGRFRNKQVRWRTSTLAALRWLAALLALLCVVALTTAAYQAMFGSNVESRPGKTIMLKPGTTTEQPGHASSGPSAERTSRASEGDTIEQILPLPPARPNAEGRAFGPPKPPYAAIAACNGKPRGASCHFSGPHREIEGQCATLGEINACIPRNPPPRERPTAPR